MCQYGDAETVNICRKDLMFRLLSTLLNRCSWRWRSIANWARRMVGKPNGRMRRNLKYTPSVGLSENLLLKNWYSRTQRSSSGSESDSGWLRKPACPRSMASICGSESRWCMMTLRGRDCATCCIASLLTPKPKARQSVT